MSAAGYLTMLGSAPGLAQIYLQGDAVGRAAVSAVGLPQSDPFRVLSLGGMGIWFPIADLEALRKKAFSGFHTRLGIILGVFLGAAVLAAVIHCDSLHQTASAIGGLCAPLWYFLTARQFLKPAGQNRGASP